MLSSTPGPRAAVGHNWNSGHTCLGACGKRPGTTWRGHLEVLERREELDGQAGLRSLVPGFLAAAALFHRLEFLVFFLPPLLKKGPEGAVGRLE